MTPLTDSNTVNTINTDMYLITLQGKESIYEQIRDQIIKFVKLGVLKPDDKLPSVRTLAMELGINPNTVQRAYNQLEQEHIIYTINKKGALVASEKNGEIDRVELYKTLEGLKEKGVEKDEILDLLNKIYGGD